RLGREPARGGLVPHLPDLLAGGPDEREVGRGAGLGELRVLRQEAVAGMDGVGAGDLGGRDDGGDPQVGLPTRGRPDADVVVGEADVRRLAVRLAVHRHGADAHLAARPDDPQGDLPAVRDQHLAEHQAAPSPPRVGGVIPVMSLNVRSEAASIPEARSANSLGFEEKNSALSYDTAPALYHCIRDWSNDCIPYDTV